MKNNLFIPHKPPYWVLQDSGLPSQEGNISLLPAESCQSFKIFHKESNHSPLVLRVSLVFVQT